MNITTILKYRLLIFLLCVIALSPFNHYAQSYNYNASQFGEEFIDMIKQPSSWQTKDWLTLTGIIGGTFALMQIDDDTRSWTQRDRSYENFLPIVISNKLGEGWGALVLGTSLLTMGILQDNPANKKFGFEVLQSFTYSLTVTGLLKFSFGRARPFVNEGPASYHPFQMRTTDYFSLPSLHTTNAFSLSTLLAAKTNNKLLKIACFTPAVFTAIARVYYDKHWTSDVFLGAAIGYFVGIFVSELHEQKSVPDDLIPPSQNNISIILPF